MVEAEKSPSNLDFWAGFIPDIIKLSESERDESSPIRFENDIRSDGTFEVPETRSDVSRLIFLVTKSCAAVTVRISRSTFASIIIFNDAN